MKAIIIYESLTGNTRKAAEYIAQELAHEGVATTLSSITDIELQALSDADLVILGGWVDGLFFFGQRPGRAGRFTKMANLTGKDVVVFCTYAVNPGSTLEQLQAKAETLGGNVIGGMTIRRNDLEGGAKELVDRISHARATA